MFNPKINVLILNWNGEKILSNCVQSVLENDYNNLVITIIDNGSSDDSLKFIHENNIQPKSRIFFTFTIIIEKHFGFLKKS